MWKKLRWSKSGRRGHGQGHDDTFESCSYQGIRFDSDRPPPSTSDDLTVQSLGGTTAASNRSPEVLQARKAQTIMKRQMHDMTAVQLKQEIERVVRENGALLSEIDYLQRRLAYLEPLLPKIYFLGNMLRSVAGDAEQPGREMSATTPQDTPGSPGP
ncbi:hypothetical protein H634G_10572 [Metarhizium anisopliae BRIP 53293]|uniref:Uncharacterized protein n=1 Tax=Metarhizium anisopliae BRIP 53293 TaxID=1291518 RepID=A0A0D9NJS1_METAN|nr:hypothetical protein H634G_10572 [Metarhizium anisopliae BRIP 53293]KJK87003.1 hypothetical protein H633G_09148 [Metarhizium anisopliae BRIP 53284]